MRFSDSKINKTPLPLAIVAGNAFNEIVDASGKSEILHAGWRQKLALSLLENYFVGESDTEHELEVFEYVRGLAADAENESLARIDAVAEVPNRRAFDEYLLKAYAANLRYSRGLAVVMIDIDLFKAVNDEHGHPKGDEVLKKIGQIIQSNIRIEDFLARYGGDEFVVVMENGDSTEEILRKTFDERMRKINEEINRYALEQELEWPGVEVGGINTHLSFGMGFVKSNELTIDELVQKADQAESQDKKRRRMEGRKSLASSGHQGEL